MMSPSCDEWRGCDICLVASEPWRVAEAIQMQRWGGRGVSLVTLTAKTLTEMPMRRATSSQR
jgi:hypothetical protein